MSLSSQNKSHSKPRYAIITPVRDEEGCIGEMIESVMAQHVLPAKWLIVDDGSTDRTPHIIESYIPQAGFIELLRLPVREKRAPGGEGAIAQALSRLDFKEYEFLARFDADVILSPDYMRRILEEFERDPKLGIAGGGLYVEKDGRFELERAPEYHVRGALKMYRRQCYADIGGLTSQIGWDTIDEVQAWTHGWKTRSFFDNSAIHRRPTGEAIRAGRIFWQRGKAEYNTWSHPLFVAVKTAKLTAEHRSLVKPLSFLGGFIACYFQRQSRIQNPAFVRTRRNQQWQRFSGLGRTKAQETHSC